ncbi:MAG: HNH endonuclease [Zetaproteobacteria bacterium]|nr:HNH endonuclease [Zetaproteobacteria bacterium]
MRPVDKSLFSTNKTTYNPYGSARTDLIDALGGYCNYCERQGFATALEVEHIQDKKTYDLLKNDWSNFLLSCKNCNTCKSTKGIENTFLPDRDNTYEIFTYLESGYIQVDPSLDSPAKEKAQALIDLVRLDRMPNRNGYKGKDTLWQERKSGWEISQRYLCKYKKDDCDVETIKDLVLNGGFWSIWMKAFKDFPEVQKELVASFLGTNKGYFE